jgi:hypothetical protein
VGSDLIRLSVLLDGSREYVSYASFRQYQFWCTRIGLDLLTQATNPDIDAAVKDVFVLAS